MKKYLSQVSRMYCELVLFVATIVLCTGIAFLYLVPLTGLVGWLLSLLTGNLISFWWVLIFLIAPLTTPLADRLVDTELRLGRYRRRVSRRFK